MSAFINFVLQLPNLVWAIVGVFKAMLIGTLVMVLWWRIANWLTDGAFDEAHRRTVNGARWAIGQ